MTHDVVVTNSTTEGLAEAILAMARDCVAGLPVGIERLVLFDGFGPLRFRNIATAIPDGSVEPRLIAAGSA